MVVKDSISTSERDLSEVRIKPFADAPKVGAD